MSSLQKNIEIKALNVGYKTSVSNNKLISEINTFAFNGELIALIGMNGSGKSTMLRSLVNFQKPLAGEILIQDKNINQYSLSELAQKVSFVSTEHVNLNNITVSEIIELGRYPYTGLLGKLTQKDQAIVDEVIVQTDLQQIVSKKLQEISDGEKQRVMIARALAQDTAVVILDEPTAYLDIQNRFEIIRLLKTLSINKNKTIIFSTHDLPIAMQLADKIWLISQSKLIEGAPEDLVLTNQFSALFSSPKIHFDNIKGDFIYSETFEKSVYLKGSGNVYEWTKKALHRNGYQVTDNNNCGTIVSIQSEGSENNWEIEKENSKFVVRSIYNLIQNLKNE